MNQNPMMQKINLINIQNQMINQNLMNNAFLSNQNKYGKMNPNQNVINQTPSITNKNPKKSTNNTNDENKKKIRKISPSKDDNNLILNRAEKDKENNNKIDSRNIEDKEKGNDEINDEVKEMIECFEIFDENKDGFIAADELKHAMMNMGERLTEEEADDMIREAKPNEKGLINYREFVKRIMSD